MSVPLHDRGWPEAPTQRVRTRSRGTAVLVVAVIGFVALGVLKPWGPALTDEAAIPSATAPAPTPSPRGAVVMTSPASVADDSWLVSPRPFGNSVPAFVAVAPGYDLSDDAMASHTRMVGFGWPGGDPSWAASCVSGCTPRGALAASPTGTEIAYLDSGPRGTWIRALDVSTGDSRPIVRCPVCDPGHVSLAWSPDGRSIAFDGGGAIWSVPARPGEAGPAAGLSLYRRLIDDARSPSYSPDGSHLMYVQGFRIVIAAADGSHPRALPIRDIVAAAAWSPAGNRVAFVTFGRAELWKADLAGQHRQLLYRGGDCCPGGWWPRSPTWSPDGQGVAWVSGADLVIAGPNSAGRVVWTPYDSGVSPTWIEAR
jgi:hypothetical protein